MKVTIILVLLSVALSACMLLPAPNLILLPLTIAVPELSPWLAAFCLLAGALAFKFRRRAAPFLLVAACILAWPLAEIPRIERRMSLLSPPPAFGAMQLRGGIETGTMEPETLPLNIRYYRPRGEGLRPGLIDIYGGAWQRGSPVDNRQFHSYLASKGFAVFAIDYRHAPAWHFPAQIEDVRAAIAFVHSNAARYQTDPGRLALCGRSAGGQLALLAAYEGGPVHIGAVISFYGPADLSRGYSDVPSPDPIDVRAVLAAYLGGTPAQVPEAFRAASPLTYAAGPVPPTLLIQGARDHIVKPVFARDLYQKLTASGNRAFLLELPWAEHAFDLVSIGVGNRLALYYVEQFLDQTIGSQP